MLRFFLRKLLRLFTLLAAVSVFTFGLIAASPIDPVDAYIGGDIMLIGAEQRAKIVERWGLNDPMPVRYVRWLGQVAQGNLGTSLIYNQPVADVIVARFSTSLALMAAAWILSGVLGFVLGIVAGARPNSWLDRAIRWYAYTLASSPTFWVALLLLIVFSVSLRWTPACCASPPGVLEEDVTAVQRIQHLILPAFTLSIIGVAQMALHTRQKLIDVLHSDYALFARAQGETTTGLVMQHGLRNIALPAITLQFATLAELFGGSVLIEQVFGYPGLGQTTIQAALRSDVPLLVGITFFSAIFVFTGNTLADVLYRLVDPRLRRA